MKLCVEISDLMLFLQTAGTLVPVVLELKDRNDSRREDPGNKRSRG